MGLRLRFNLVMIAVLLVTFGAVAALSHLYLQQGARQEVLREARLILAAASSIRNYTVEQVQPHLLAQMAEVFLPQSVPAYAATETINSLRRHQAHYGYKEAVLNPTNPRNRTTDWEADLVHRFRQDPELQEWVGERPTPTGPSLFIAKPIQVTHAACLQCHGAPGAAPASLLRTYGPANGFGWKQGEIVGAQIVDVPMAVPMAQAWRLFTTFTVSLAAVFLLLCLALNLALGWLVLGPIRRMARGADRVSTGDFTEPEFSDRGRDEIARLGLSFNRMRRSLRKAMDMLHTAQRR